MEKTVKKQPPVKIRRTPVQGIYGQVFAGHVNSFQGFFQKRKSHSSYQLSGKRVLDKIPIVLQDLLYCRPDQLPGYPFHASIDRKISYDPFIILMPPPDHVGMDHLYPRPSFIDLSIRHEGFAFLA